MDFSFGDEQTEFRDAVARFFANRLPTAAVRRQIAADHDFDDALWTGLRDELGVCGVQVSDTHGGLGFGLTELAIVMEEMGRALCPAPYFGSSVLACEVLRHCALAEVQSRLLPAIAGGHRLAALVVADATGRWASQITARTNASGTVVNGIGHYVVGGMQADVLIVVATDASDDGNRPGLYAVESATDGVRRRPLQVIDRTRPQAEIRFDDAAAEMLSDGIPIDAGLDRAYDHAAIALANEMVGGAQRLLDMSVGYAGLRMQFGRLIGSFQAIKHKLADMLLDVELAKSTAYYAARAADEGADDVSALASLTLASAAETFMRCATECIQIHGGIGFTWEHDAHLWYRRAKSSEVLLGTPDQHRERYLQELEASA